MYFIKIVLIMFVLNANLFLILVEDTVLKYVDLPGDKSKY